MDKPYLAHRREDTGEEQLLIDHLRGTAELAEEFGKDTSMRRSRPIAAA